MTDEPNKPGGPDKVVPIIKGGLAARPKEVKRVRTSFHSKPTTKEILRAGELILGMISEKDSDSLARRHKVLDRLEDVLFSGEPEV